MATTQTDLKTQDPNAPPEPRLDAYTVEETAAVFGVSRQTVYNWLDAGKLGVIYSGGGTRWLVTGDSIRKHMEAAQ